MKSQRRAGRYIVDVDADLRPSRDRIARFLLSIRPNVHPASVREILPGKRQAGN